MELEYLLISSNKEEKEANQGYLNLKYILKAETRTTIKRGLVAGIIIPLDTVSITL